MKRMKYSLLFLAAGLVCGTVSAAVEPGTFFSDHMVLQREMPVPVWGKADPGEKVTVEFAGQKKAGVAGKDGRWRIDLAPLKTDKKGGILKISGKTNTVEFKDVLVGEVWFCAGQSNMYLPLIRPKGTTQQFNGPELAKTADHPLIRFAKVPNRWSLYPRPDWLKFKWEVMSPDNVGPTSAVAFFFGRKLMQELQIPIGLIQANWGGSKIEPWTAPVGYKMVPQGAEYYRQIMTRTPGTAAYKKEMARLKKEYRVWMRRFNKAVAENTVPPRPPVFPTEFMTVETRYGNRTPAAYYNSMLLPLMPAAMRGVIWYQGCSNIGDGSSYIWKLEALYKGWQKCFDNPALKFYVVQLAPYAPPRRDPELLPAISFAQQCYVDTNPNAALVVINDVGDLKDIHPRDKTQVGLRLANIALKYDYGRKDIKADFPRLANCRAAGKTLVLSFKNVEKWSCKSQSPRHFEIAGADGKFRRAEAVIRGTDIILSSPQVAAPEQVRFMWHAANEGELFNEAGLPMGVFLHKVK